MTTCKCGNNKPKRYNRCGKCFNKMTEGEKQAYVSKSKQDKAGTLRRWA